MASEAWALRCNRSSRYSSFVAFNFFFSFFSLSCDRSRSNLNSAISRRNFSQQLQGPQEPLLMPPWSLSSCAATLSEATASSHDAFMTATAIAKNRARKNGSCFVHSSHSKRREKPSCKNQTIEKLRDPSHFLGPIFVNPKHPIPATKRAFEVNEGRTDVSTSRYERIVQFDKANVAGVEVFVTSHKDLWPQGTGALWPSATIKFLRSYERPIRIVWKIQNNKYGHLYR